MSPEKRPSSLQIYACMELWHFLATMQREASRVSQILRRAGLPNFADAAYRIGIQAMTWERELVAAVKSRSAEAAE